VLIALCLLRFAVLPYYDNRLNAVLAAEAYPVSPAVREFHQTSFVADMHADSLLWGRELDKSRRRGQLDLPRLRAGGVDLQVFSVVTKVPWGLNYEANADDSDILPILFIAAWRSPATWFDPKQRALVQARDLSRLADRSSLSLVLRRRDLAADGLRGLLALEGMHALGGRADNLDEFFAAGYRMMGLAHFFDNEIAGSAHGQAKHGLTELGRRLVERMESLGITIDLAHASATAFADTIALATRPLVVSHTGVKATCAGARNLSDEQLRAIAGNGGVVGIGYWKGAVCDASLAGITRAIGHAVEVAGIDHVGLGSDFDGSIVAPFDSASLPQLTASLLASGLSKAEVGKILGGNLRRVLDSNLPE
jgi:microsomal dipeptidase-like Zn-dependent dipeptidase